MPDSMSQVLGHWQTFYVLTGTASATLIGLIFIAASLGASMVTPETAASVHVWVTPTVIHFGSALFIAVFLTVPTLTSTSLGIILALAGLIGLWYAILIGLKMWRESRKHSAPMSNSDWFWYLVLPAISYLSSVVGGIVSAFGREEGLDLIAFGIIALLVLGVRNAWDLMLWIAQNRKT